MKRFFVSVLFAAVFFVGLGALVENVGAKFRSDEKALALINAARTAIGGDSAVAAVQSLRVTGRATRTFKIDGAERSDTGDTEIALQLPDKLMKMVKIGGPDGDGGVQGVHKQVDVVVVGNTKDGNIGYGKGEGHGTVVGPEPGRKIVIKRDDGTTEELKGSEGEQIIIRRNDKAGTPLSNEQRERHMRIEREEAESHHTAMRQNELFRLTLGLLLSTPDGKEANYTYGGEAEFEGIPCNIVVAEYAGSTMKLYLNRSSNLPVVMTYTGEQMPMMRFEHKVPAPAGGEKDVIFFKRTAEPAAAVQAQLRFADYRSVGGVQLPFRWTTIAGDMREVFEVANYDVNPANIGDAFQNQKVMVRTKANDQ